jgi:hypothetical protein
MQTLISASKASRLIDTSRDLLVRRVKAGLLKPDGLSVTGAPLFKLSRVNEIRDICLASKWVRL